MPRPTRSYVPGDDEFMLKAGRNGVEHFEGVCAYVLFLFRS